MDDLIAFVTARLDEDEAVARACADFDELACADVNGVHLSTARVLREVAAKREILARCEFARNQVAVGAVNESAGYGSADTGWPLRADSHELDARSLAAAWSDHPDYRQEWAQPSDT